MLFAADSHEGSTANLGSYVGSESRCRSPRSSVQKRQHPRELISLCVRLYLRYPLSNQQVTQLM